jgi:isopenicillin-N N-acyltransferase-like protein
MQKPPLSRRRVIGAFGLLALLALAAYALADGLLGSRASRAIGSQASAWLARADAGEILEARFTIESVEGLPKELAGHSGTLRWRAPDRLFLETVVKGEEISAGRDGETVWVHLPKKPFTLVGDPTVPRFAADPDSVEAVELPALVPPVSALQARLIPFLVEASRMGEEGDGLAWRIEPSRLGREWAGLPEFRLGASTLEGELRRLRVGLPGAKSLVLAIERLGFADPADPVPAWTPPEEALASADRVALSHLTRFLRVASASLGKKAPPLPPYEGRRELVASSGKGRLELHDGLRVLFLEGSPEEMGRQQGELLRDEVRSVTDRILYGVGVGSSFGKGRWFFGEIEEAQSRVEPFAAAEHLREMDALAAAAGLHRQEARLANFFPELFHCSGFALHGSATVDGRLYHGRILDYMRGAGLEENAVVAVCRPDWGNAWVNVTYAGFLGSVTAMNEKQVAIGEMGGRGEGDWDGKAMAQLVREVMERCDTVEEAVALMREGPRTCEYYYVVSDAKSGRAVGIKATPEIFETVWSGESHPQLPDPVADTVLLSAGDRYAELVRRVKAGHGRFDADAARELMTRPVCMESNIQSVLFAPDTLDFWVANADGENVASHTRYTRLNLAELLGGGTGPAEPETTP